MEFTIGRSELLAGLYLTQGIVERRLREDPTFRATVERLERLLERPC